MKDKIARGAAWNGATRVLVNLVSLASSVLLARLLVPADFGLVATATTVFGILSSVTELSLSSALIRHPDPTDRHFDVAWTLGLARSLLLAVVMSASAPVLASVFNEPRLLAIVLVLAGSIAIGGLTNPKLVVFQRQLEFWQGFALQVTTRVVMLAATLAVALVQRSYWALIAGMVASQITQVLLSYVLLPYRPSFRLAGARELLDFTVWLSLGQAVNTLNWKSDPLLVGYFLGPTALGHYTFGDNLAQLPSREAIAPIAQTLFPAFSRISGDPAAVRAAYVRAQTFLFMIALPAGCGFAAIAEPVVTVLLGAKWLPSVLVIQALASVMAVQTLTSPLQALAMSLGNTRALFQRDLVGFATRIPLLVVGAVLGGVRGVVLARIASGLIGMAINVGLASRLTGISAVQQFATNFRAFAATAGMVVVVLALQHVPGLARLLPGDGAVALGVIVLVGAATYVVITTVLWRVAGRPRGAEHEVLSLFLQYMSKRRLAQSA
jgi:PST family polysaccharide transporter